VVIVAVTIALSSLVYSQMHFPVTAHPVFSFETYSVAGSPSILHVQVNSSSQAELAELRVDEASSSSGILALIGSSYGTLRSLCASNATTFFSVTTTQGTIQVSGDGSSWIDGAEEGTAQVPAGQHELIISDASTCEVTLPGGEAVGYLSPPVSSVPEITSSPETMAILVPYETSSHTITAVFDGAIETIGF
jgi:hypothetical protein